MVAFRTAATAVLLLAAASVLAAQSTSTDRQRQAFAQWLATAPTSPLRAIAHQRVGEGLTLGGEGSAIVLEGTAPARVEQRGTRVVLVDGGLARPLARGVPQVRGPYRLVVSGSAPRATLTVFGDAAKARAPSWFPANAAATDTVQLTPGSNARVLLLSSDGSDAEAHDAGTVTTDIAGAPVTLVVRRFPGASEDESELEIFFRDATNDDGSYPAGRFVTLVPLGGGRYLLDFNAARNPWCAYNTVFPCPAPWPGNAIPSRVEAGEKYP